MLFPREKVDEKRSTTQKGRSDDATSRGKEGTTSRANDKQAFSFIRVALDTETGLMVAICPSAVSDCGRVYIHNGE
ncbi:hypothetical protein V1478_012097 [Vespula squamosa]|uniref:Uncharacterized protein n=1 Tax=Vespula squamosa TaxID=30214 RepID=A0ABD2ACV5_VESSQ